MQRSVVVLQHNETVEVSSHKPYYELCLNDGMICNIQEFSYIISLVINNIPDNLESIDLVIGSAKVKTYKREDLLRGENLIPIDNDSMSLSNYYFTKLHFHYDREYIVANEVSETVNEYTEIVTFSDTEEEYFDGSDYCNGLRVFRRMVPSGTQKTHIIKGAHVVLPQLNLVVLDRE